MRRERGWALNCDISLQHAKPTPTCSLHERSIMALELHENFRGTIEVARGEFRGNRARSQLCCRGRKKDENRRKCGDLPGIFAVCIGKYKEEKKKFARIKNAPLPTAFACNFAVRCITTTRSTGRKRQANYKAHPIFSLLSLNLRLRTLCAIYMRYS